MDGVVSQLEKALKCQELSNEAAMKGQSASRYRASHQHLNADMEKVPKSKEREDEAKKSRAVSEYDQHSKGTDGHFAPEYFSKSVIMSTSFNRGTCNHISLDLIKHATNNFSESNVLGKGGEGKVYLANINFDSMLTPVAVKQLNENSTEFDKEIRTMSEIEHNNIVSLLGYCDESGQKILVYEFMEKGSLTKYVRKNPNSSSPLPWFQRLRICLDAARGLQYLHVQTTKYPFGIVHRDIKPDNILLDENWVAKISDFGMFKVSEAGQVESVMETGFKGTNGYLPPEYNRFSRKVTRKIDVYSFGVVLFQVLCHKMPWYRVEESYYAPDDEDYGILAEENVDPEIKADICDDSLKAYASIIGKSLKADPDKRPTMDGVVWQLEIALKCQELLDEKVMNSQAARESYHMHSRAGSRSRASSVVSDADVEYTKAVVLDIGEGVTKAGFAGDDYPQAVFASGIGCPKSNEGSSRTYIGKDLSSYMGELTLRNPSKDGIVVGWDDYENILHHTLYNELNYGPENKRPVLLTEPPLKHNATNGERGEYVTNREKMIKFMFEEFDVPALYIGSHPVLSLFASGNTTGLVIESGEDVSHSVPIYEGHVLPNAVTSLRFAGRGITNNLMKILNEERHCSFSTRADHDILRDIKAKMAYVALKYKAELEKSKRMYTNYTLPDGKTIFIGQELFQCPEALFNPSLVGIGEPGIHENMYNSLVLCNEEIREQLYGSIVLSGGSTMLAGFGERMEEEIRGFVPLGTNFKMLSYPKRYWGAWIGGSIVASSDSFQKAWITKREYDEYGLDAVHEKYF